ncbi:hypothetical protein quinque_006418 [Culex quinquefasciatus]
MEHFRPKLILQCTILFEFLTGTVHGIICQPTNNESYTSWPTEFSGSANLFQFRPPNAVNVSCVNFQGTRVQNVLQMEFNCDAQIRKLLEPMVADFGKHDAFGVRSWNPLLVEACTGAAERDDLGPVGLEKNPTLVYCSHQTPSPNCSYRVNIPIGYNSFFVSLGNKTTPYTTWYESNKGIRPSFIMMRTLKVPRNDVGMEFNCDAQIRKLLEPMVADFGKHDAFGVRSWNPLLVEACTGAAEQDDLGPVGPNCSYRVNIPIGYNSFFVSLGNKTTPYTTCCLFTAALAIQCNPASSETISSWPKASRQCPTVPVPSQLIISPQCVSFQATRAQNVLQLKFHCDEKYRSQLEPILTDLRRTEAFGVRNWNPLLVESCFGEDVLAALGPVGVEQSPLNVDCTIFIPRPSSTFRVEIPLAHDSICVVSLTGNKSTPFSLPGTTPVHLLVLLCLV